MLWMGIQREVSEDTNCVEKQHASPQVHPSSTRRARRSKTPNKLQEVRELTDLKELKGLRRLRDQPCQFGKMLVSVPDPS